MKNIFKGVDVDLSNLPECITHSKDKERFSPKTRYIAGLDALRALAITLITLFHVFPDTYVGGYIGVCLFLVITGFLLAYSSSYDYLAEKFSIGHYFLKRLKRLYPSLLLVILTTVGVYHFLLPNVLEDSGKEIVSICLGFNNWWQLAMNADYFARVVNASPFTHMWFLGVEIEYIMLWPLLFGLCMLLKHKKIKLLILAGLISASMLATMALQGVEISRLYYGTDTRIFSCLFGGAMGLWFAEHRESVSCQKLLNIRYDILLGILLIPVLAATLMLNGQNLFLYTGGMQLLTLIFCMILFTVIDDPILGNRLESSTLKWIGGHSYEIFLWQYPVLFLFQRQGWDETIQGSVLAILMILALSAYSQAILDFVRHPKLNIHNEGWVLRSQRYTIVLMAIASAVIICFGMRDVLASDFNPEHKPGYKLKMELEQKQAELEKAQAEIERARAIKEAEQATKIKNEQERLAAQLRGAGVTMIGDSVMVGASSSIAKLMPEAYIDALSCRDVCGGFETAQKLAQENKLGNVVVVALGTNGPLLKHEPYASGMQNLLNILGTERQIFWITTYCSYSQWMKMNNQYLAELEKSRPNFHVIDWYPLAKGHPDWLHSDGTHPNIEGASQYAKLIHETLKNKLTVH